MLEKGFEPPCNVYIGSSHNEEIGGDGIPTALKYFEEQNINSLKEDSETYIGIYSVMAQSESENISANVKWGISKRKAR